MSVLNVVSVTAYTVTVVLHADTDRYHLSFPEKWSLNHGEQAGVSSTVTVFIDSLLPDTRYLFQAAGEVLRFRTASCNGCVDASLFGVNETSKNNAMAFSAAIAATPEGGTLSVPKGRFLTGPIFLKSRMTLLLCKGAEIMAITDRRDWPILPATDDSDRVVGTWEGLPEASYASLITAIGCEQLFITGHGVVDGGGDRGDWWTWPKETRQDARRARTLFLAHCNDVGLSGFTVQNSPSWTVHPYKCNKLSAAALNIENPAESPNTDGFNPESCTHVHLSGLKISVGDDCIAVKAGKRGTGTDERTNHIAPTRHLTIRNSLMLDGHGAVVMGSEMSGDIADVSILLCEFKGTDRGLRIKTRRGRGGQVARILMRDVKMEGVGTAVAVNAFYYCDSDGKSDAVQSRNTALLDQTTPVITDISIENIILTGVQHAVAALLGLPEEPLRKIRLKNISISYDLAAQPGEVLMACHVPRVLHGGILHQFADVHVDDVLTKHQQELSSVI
ncbi:MAG: glycoside hydrolase family 28 protein [Granulosicoccus sp.]